MSKNFLTFEEKPCTGLLKDVQMKSFDQAMKGFVSNHIYTEAVWRVSLTSLFSLTSLLS